MKIPELRPNVELGEFVVMPNHIHGIIRLSGRGELHSPKIGVESHSPHNRGVFKTPQYRKQSGQLRAAINRRLLDNWDCWDFVKNYGNVSP